MTIDINTLKHKTERIDGSIVAQCPACAFNGNDTKGDHLILYPDGRFGCVVNVGDKEHKKEIINLAGKPDGKDASVSNQLKVTIKPYKAPRSELIEIVPRFTLEALGYTPPVSTVPEVEKDYGTRKQSKIEDPSAK